MAEYLDMEMNWSVETYRLDEVEHKFQLPCVILVNEGYYSETDAEGFSSGDIMSIDKKVVLHKVAANFAYEHQDSRTKDKDYVDLAEREILVPLNYRGKLKVLKHEKNYDSVSELARDFPRYAKLRVNWKVKTEDNVIIEVKAGTVIELDRTIPGHISGTKVEPDKLVVMFKHLNKHIMVAMPYTDKAKFRTEPDNNKYTIQEAIDRALLRNYYRDFGKTPSICGGHRDEVRERYSLPQHVKFVDDEIRRVYTQDLMEGIANMKTITETLRLNRLLTQTVLVGHYKPVEEPSSDEPADVRKRTLIVIPLDNKEIREIEVNVLLDATEDDYEMILGVRNVSNTDELVDGSLYVDFAMSTPGIRRISHKPFVIRDTEDIPPPVPPKPPSMQPQGSGDIPTDTGDYLVPSTPTSLGFSLADLDFSSLQPPPKSKHKKPKKPKKQKDKPSKTSSGPKLSDEKTVYNREPMPLPSGEESCTTDDLVVYDTVDERTMIEVSSKPESKANVDYKPLPKARPVYPIPSDNSHEFQKFVSGKQVARVQPETRAVCRERRLFKDLSCEELVERLEFCGLHDVARTCENGKLNGAFFQNIPTDLLKETMNLTGLQLAKFIQMRDENWMPT